MTRQRSNGKPYVSDAALVLCSGGVAVIRTDTLYGIVGQALNRHAVSRIYALKKREQKKPFIILISQKKDLALFGIKPNVQELRAIKNLWPGPNTLIFKIPDARKFRHLHRGLASLAFRLPNNKSIISLLKRTGPLVAPSANIAGEITAKTIEEAREAFGEGVDYYVDGGKVVKKGASKIFRMTDKGLEKLR